MDLLKNIAVKNDLNLDRVITLGHSVGRHLALWAAGRKHIPENNPLYMKDPLKIYGVVALSAAVDLKSLIGSDTKICGDKVVLKLLGGLPDDVPQNYKICSPLETLPLGIPQVLIVGEYDIPVIKETGLKYSRLAQDSGDKVKFHVRKKASHHEAAAPGSVA